ncbi:MAG: hypothetical protein COA79_05730 [Planctomycetota bacterium]|nr:MAG: hypothetical protein COA79_05730 [Planctomycetota bacterium]
MSSDNKLLFNQLKSLLFLPPQAKHFIKWAKSTFKFSGNKIQGELLLDVKPNFRYILQSVLFSDYFYRVASLKPKLIVPCGEGFASKVRSIFFNVTPLGRLHRSFGATSGLRYFNISFSSKFKKESMKIFSELENKRDLLNLHFEDIPIGDLIYDSYLRVYSVTTVDLKDMRLKNLICSALEIVQRCKNYLNTHDVKLVLLSHAVYIEYGLIARCAAFRGIDVYVVGHIWGTPIRGKITKDHFLQTVDHYQYPTIFNSLANKENRLESAKIMLKNRFTGVIDSSIAYMKNSAYGENNKSDKNIFLKSDKKRILIMLHCFFDSPHIYKSMVFEDFYEWIYFTLSKIDYQSYDVYVKPHPNGLVGNEPIIRDLEQNFKLAKFIDKQVSNSQILKESLDCVITVCGTVGHEFAYHDIPVITAGDNPHSAYNFCKEAKTKEEYLNLVNSVGGSLPIEINKSEIEEFFYMHYLYVEDEAIKGASDLFKCSASMDKSRQYDPEILSEFTADFDKSIFKEFDSKAQIIFDNFCS